MLRYLTQCDHKKVKRKLIAWAYVCRGKHYQWFRHAMCCKTCGVELKKMSDADISLRGDGEVD